MELARKEIIINAPFPTKACGHIEQTFLIDEYKDDLHARIIAIKDKELYIHISLDLLGLKEKICQKIKDIVTDIYGDAHVIVSTTHTHYGNDVEDDRYITYLLELLSKELRDLDFKYYDELYYRVHLEHFKGIGSSRISGYETDNEYLLVIELSSSMKKEDTQVVFIMHNIHPTILKSTTPFFSSEFPGKALELLKEENKEIFFTYVTGASGDFSTRFTRKDQTYDSVIELGTVLKDEVIKLLDEGGEYKKLDLSFEEVVIEYKHDFSDIDLSKLRSDLTPRELETIENGKIMRQRIYENPEKEATHAIVDIVDLGDYSLIFYPNEIFSAYLDYIDTSKAMIISYSNGYEPYILPIGFTYVTYEMFMDTLSLDTKKELVAFLERFK